MTEKTEKLLSEVQQLLHKYGDDCILTLEPGRIKLANSYRVRSRKERLRICSMLVQSDLTKRSKESLSAEWNFHNAAYYLHVRPESAKDADLDYVRDERKLVRIATKVFEILHLY